MNQHFTIGMAGHIDHGKTTLTKALTGVDTDRLKEEKERSISIEPGYAPLIQEEDLQVSIVDVPGHERFIRQMIAGVAGIDMVILVIAADEGVMPQTREHLHILALLGIEHGFIVMTKTDQADPELLAIIEEDVMDTINDTFLKNAPIFHVDSVSKKGIEKLKTALKEKARQLPEKNRQAPFRLPVDQVFTVKGQGVVVRGTIYDGVVRQGERLELLPSKKEVRVRQIQSHHEQREFASAGQRTAINLGGITHDEVMRGDVLVADDSFTVTDRIDVALQPIKGIEHRVKQRLPIKLYIGTSEVMGKVIFYDRNELIVNETEEVFCQIELSEQVVAARGDRFILRRATPMETIGGGSVIEPNAEKHRFGEQTIDELKQKKEGSPTDRLRLLMTKQPVLTKLEIVKGAAISEEDFAEVLDVLVTIEKDLYTLDSILESLKEKIVDQLTHFHESFPMKTGLNKAEITSELQQYYPRSLVEYTLNSLDKECLIQVINQFVSLSSFTPTYPTKWKVELEQIEKTLREQGAEVDKWDELTKQAEIPAETLTDFYYYLIESERVFVFDDERLISKEAIETLKFKLAEVTNREAFNLQMAREALQLSRKNLVPLLELFDQLGYTERLGNIRTWIDP